MVNKIKYGYGYGYGAKSGHGYGARSISGSGSRYGFIPKAYSCIGEIGNHQIIVYKPWPVIQIGCEVHSISTWKNQWKEIASEYSIDIDPDIATKILNKARKLCIEDAEINV